MQNGKFIELFEKRHRGFITNIILSAIKDGQNSPDAVISWIENDLERRKKYGKLSAHLKILENNFDHENLYSFINEYIEYQNLPYEERQKVKKIKTNAKAMQKRLIKDIINRNRPLSWSSISQWKYSKEEWFNKYVKGIKQTSTAELEFGSAIGKKLEIDPTYFPEIPRYGKDEYAFRAMLGVIPLVGYADSFNPTTCKQLGERKTGRKKWDQKRVNEHGQLTMYCLLNYIQNKIKPEEVEITLSWMPTAITEDGDFTRIVSFDGKIKTFNTKRTMSDILNFAKEIKEIYAEMKKYVENKG